MKRRKLLMLMLVGGAFAACLSPTLPLPPPERPDEIGPAGAAGVWNVRGGNTPGAVVLIKNIDTGVISGTEDKDSDGRYFIQVEGEMCDRAEVYELVGTITSDTTFFVLETTVNGLPQGECPR